VHFDVDCKRPLSAWVRGVNAHLPPAIAVRHAALVDPGFHARYGALRRSYRYLLLSAPTREPLLSGRVGWTHRGLDRSAMGDAAAVLIGEHDFSAFRAAQCQARSPIRRIESIIVERLDDDQVGGQGFPGTPSGSGQLLQIRIVGNAFLHHMVRNIVGALVMVGAGQRPVRWLRDVLVARDRRLSAPTFDAAGLFFEGVEYDRRFALPSWPQFLHSGPTA
jgi:tRNA pseudouridine38-40 synthase